MNRTKTILFITNQNLINKFSGEKLKKWTKLFFLSAALLCVLDSQAQSDTTSIFKLKKHDFSFNATPLISSLFGQNNTNTNNLYSLIYRGSNGKTAFRMAVGYVTEASEFFNPNQGGNTKFRDHFIRLKPGIERHHQIHKNVYLNFGFDFMVEANLAKSSIGNDFVNRNRDYSIGFGPALRFEYALSDAISLYTELPLYIVRSWDTANFSGSGDFDRTNATNQIFFQLPLQLHFAFHF